MTLIDQITLTWMGKPLWIWGILFIFIPLLLLFDLGVLNRHEKVLTVKRSLRQSLFYIIIGLSYGAWIWFYFGAKSGHEYLTGYLVEKSLSIDNIFVISLVFHYFKIPLAYQHRVLFLGILGVVVLRAIMIALGAVIISRFEWVTYIFSAFLILTGVKMLFMKDKETDIGDNVIVRFLRNHLRVTPELHGEKLFVRLSDDEALNTNSPSTTIKSAQGKHLWVTPLFLALVVIELADIMFAVDSIPAIFTITQDPYIVYTSNIFAIFGLRALYFSLAAILHRFTYLKFALALVLIFIGAKVFAAWWLDIEKISTGISLSVTAALIGGGILFSLFKTRTGKIC